MNSSGAQVAVLRGTAALEEAQENHQVNVATAVTV